MMETPTQLEEAVREVAEETCFQHEAPTSLHEAQDEEACEDEAEDEAYGGAAYDDEATWPEEIKKMKARSEAWAAQARRKLEESGRAAAYDAWKLRMVQKALDSAQYISHEEVVAETEAWYQAALKELEAQGRRMEDEDEEEIYAFEVDYEDEDEADNEAEAETEMGSQSQHRPQRNSRLY